MEVQMHPTHIMGILGILGLVNGWVLADVVDRPRAYYFGVTLGTGGVLLLVLTVISMLVGLSNI